MPSRDTMNSTPSETAFCRTELGTAWNGETGLWKSKGRNHPTAHVIRSNAATLARIALTGDLHKVPAERILRGLRQAQEKNGNYRGNFWWELEDGEVLDRNSGFFTTIQLLILHFEYRKELNNEARQHLDAMLKEASIWFRHKVYPIQRNKLIYPNAYYGDAVCLWLLTEIHGGVPEDMKEDMLGITRFYLNSNWGWGEHLSDMYAKIIQQEIASMLLWSRQLTAELRALTEAMMRDLMDIDAVFEGGPRVPTIRCYWFEKSPRTPEEWPVWFKPYRMLMADDSASEFNHAHLLYKKNIHVRFHASVRTSPDVKIDCYDGAQATAWVDEKWRYGCLTRYPLFDDNEMGAGFNLHYQVFPVAFWHHAGDWGYLQFQTRTERMTMSLPAMKQGGRNRLSPDGIKDPARYGFTYGMRHEKSMTILRELPVIHSKWEWMADRWRHINGTAAFHADSLEGWRRLLLQYGDEMLTIACLPLGKGVQVEQTEEDGELYFTANFMLDTDERPNHFRLLWYIEMAAKPVSPPLVTPMDDSSWTVRMNDGTEYQIDAGNGWRSIKIEHA